MTQRNKVLEKEISSKKIRTYPKRKKIRENKLELCTNFKQKC